MSWTDERVTTLRRLWLEGLSASQIARQLGEVTRNAVIGKVHRLGLSGRAAPSQPQRPVYKPQRQPRVATMETRTAVAHAPAALPAVIVLRTEEPGSATVLTLGAHMCKWPIGDPATNGFSFCGRRSEDGAPYCTEHARLAYQPQQKKARRTDATELTRSLRRYI